MFFFFCIILRFATYALFISIRFIECLLAPNSLRGVRTIAKSDYWLSHICQSHRSSVRTELGFHWRDFPEILYLIIFRKSVKRIQL